MKMLYVIFIHIFILLACSKPVKSEAQQPVATTTTVTYTESNEDFPNPERGFYRYSETNAGNFTALDLNQLKNWRGLTEANGGNYQVYSTLIFRYYVLDIFKNQPLTPAFINSVKTDCNIARLAGVKLIPRFTYTNAAKTGSCPEKFICPPYGDAPKAIVLQHIAQLKDVFYENADVIACVQMGFIGVWGEQYYTDFFGDASKNATQGKLVDANWQDRIDVLKALLAAVPKTRMIQVRYPQLKQRAVYGINALTNIAPLVVTEAFSQAEKARIGFHNDCFLASPDDYGTFEDYGNSATPRKTDLAVLKNYQQEDGKYVVTGGETCDDTYSPQNDCAPAGIAQQEMRNLHYSFLNCAYNNAVNNDWQTGGCMEEIKKNLGYRFVLKEATFPKKIKAGDFFSFKINLENKGYASCFNERHVYLILRNKTTGQQFTYITDGNPQKWYSGAVNWESSMTLQSEIPDGNYEILLNLPDVFETIINRPEYAIRLANVDCWEPATGYNNLNLTLQVYH